MAAHEGDAMRPVARNCFVPGANTSFGCRPVVVVGLPGEIDLTNAGETLALITAAFRPSVTVVIAGRTQ